MGPIPTIGKVGVMMACPVLEPVGKQMNRRDWVIVQEFEGGVAQSVLRLTLQVGLGGDLGPRPGTAADSRLPADCVEACGEPFLSEPLSSWGYGGLCLFHLGLL